MDRVPKIIPKLWKNSASLILLVKNSTKRKSDYNYDVTVLLAQDCVMFKRTEKTSLFQKTYVFPGGVLDKMDESKEWLQLYESLGIPLERFYVLTNITGPRPFIFRRETQNAIPREISLRITAFRETFEELGILICKSKEQFNDKKLRGTYTTYVDKIDVMTWQNLVHNDSAQFLRLCQKLKVAPDLWNSYEWSDWLTPASFAPRRFETVFYITALDSLPPIHGEVHEVESFDVRDPKSFMNLFYKGDVWLAPPQMYEIGRLKNQKKIESIIEFARKREPRGLTMFYPTIYQTKDKIVHIYPGDDLYPREPDYDKQYDFDKFLETTAEQLREGLENIHRLETETLHDSKLYMNIHPPNGHLVPYNELFLASKL